MLDGLDDVDEIIKDFLIECEEHLDNLDHGLVVIEQDPSDRKTLSSIFRSIHTIKGGSGMLGFGNLEKLTHSAENLLSLLRDGKLELNTEMITVLLQTVDAVRLMLGLIGQTGNDGADSHDALIESLVLLQTPTPKNESSPTLTVDTKPSVVPEEIVVVPEQSNSDGVMPTDLLTSELNLDPDLLKQGEQDKATEEQPMSETPIPASVPNAVHIEEEKQTSESIQQAHPVAEDLVHPDAKTAVSAGETTVRINVELLDKLMNLVGELVLSRNQILQFVASMSDSNFLTVSQRLNLITSELQEGVMKTRMQPIGNVWGKFNRVVRDLATSCAKKVNLELSGSETELDKTLIEAIKDPLTHIVRNSVDHGIETPEQRLKAGKPEEGTLSLKAYHEGGHVHIEIHDDGAGISSEKVKNKALEKGLISTEQAARMSERDALNLIFMPGLSTAEKVTNVSGRGVGMDVVRTNIERINGTIDIQSKVGIYTILKIKIPLTLAIIPALIVTCNNSRYAIPQISLLELVHLETEECKKSIKYIKNTPLYQLRGKLLPLVFLSQELELDNQDVDIDFERGMNIVVLQAGDTQFGLVVDRISDTQEIVVKPLSKLLKAQSAFSGATIMGDGKISLILDVTGLARKAQLLSSTMEANKMNQNDINRADNTERLTLLLLRAGLDKLMAVPLQKVDRIEEFPISSIESVGDSEVVQYRDSIMPLLDLGGFINGQRGQKNPEENKVQVVVHSQGTNNFGLIVDQVCDIVEGSYTIHEHLKRRGILGSSVIEDKVTEILDLEGIMRSALPNYFSESVRDI